MKITKLPPSPGDIDGVPIAPCVRSGHCCKAFTCAIGVAHGAPARGPCVYLRGDQPGGYSCGLVDDGTVTGEFIGVGTGCCQPMFNEERNAVLRSLSRTRA